MTEDSSLYDRDYVLWSETQVRTLREAGRSGAAHALDWDNLADEIERLARFERRALRSHVGTIVENLLRLQCFDGGARPAWREAILQARLDVELILEESPSLAAEVPGLIDDVTPGVARALDAHPAGRGMVRPGWAATLSTPLTERQVLGGWMPE